ncbi:hypothetical protein [Flagellimonas amoyensis]|uniref:hypothetical protein n=1 Tax=Flagellimonas amoyensis TaxID=2169401 RepID=UPI000D367BA2|nr:hypothetical protein [Allomuricauda amoyensis]
MKIGKSRVRNINPYLRLIPANADFFIGLTDLQNHHERLIEIGFTNELNVNEQVLPTSIGPISEYNSEGKYNIRKDLEKETYYQTREWTWKDWSGYEHSKIVYIARERYPREFVPPPSEEFKIAIKDGSKLLISKQLNKADNADEIRHIINLYLELFGECDVLTAEMAPPLSPNVIRLNWRILPPGEYPWEVVQNEVTDIIQRQPEGNRPVANYRIETISDHTPNFVAVGQGGFNDYLVFGFPNKNIYVLESIRTGNATYVFDRNWQELSQLSKKEILDNDLYEERIIHREGWEENINNLLN